jgi:murein DD-endopeptidase MepM/ murein hydrolase activator NlpD
MQKKFFLLFFLISLIVATYGTAFNYRAVEASIIDELKAKWNDQSVQLKKIQDEIDAYKKEADRSAQQAKSLQGALQILEQTKQKFTKELAATQNDIQVTSSKITDLGSQINDREQKIQLHSQALAETLRQMHQSDSDSFLENLLSSSDLSVVWNDIAYVEQVQKNIGLNLTELKNLRDGLLITKQETEQKKQELQAYTQLVTTKKQVIEYTAAEKAKLLMETKNQEATYQKLIQQKKADEAAFEQELLNIESQLKLAVNPNDLPQTGSVLSWPLAKVVITQYFGTTPFSTANPQVYSGNGHNGIDLGAPIGTSVKAALGGVVAGVGDTDLVCPHASYGRWVLIKHPNGLSTLYGHLSVINVQTGQTVSTGDPIALSGNTGYSTGPHLHFTVYATEGMKVGSYKSKACGGTYVMPLAEQKAYLNPLSYLPH